MISSMSDAQMNKAIIDSLPKRPKRGTYYWWMKEVLRQYTGAHFLDSGGAYGRRHSSPVAPEDVDPITAVFMNGDLEGAIINTGHFFASVLEADDEIALSIEQIIHWAGNMISPNEDWGTSIQDASNMMEVFKDFIKDGDYTFRFMKKDFIENWLAHKYEEIYFPYSMHDQTKEEYLEEAARTLPVQAIRILYNGMVLGEFESDVQSDNTYNNENDLSQDFVFYLLGGELCHEYVIIRSHNGCDARGGYSDPVVARVKDESYFWNWRAEVLTEADSEDVWRYSRAKKDLPDIADLLLWDKHRHDTPLPGFTAPPNPVFHEHAGDGDALVILDDYADWKAQADEEEVYEFPLAIETDHLGKAIGVIRDGYYQAEMVRLWNNDTQSYSAGIYNSVVYGW